MAKFINLYSGSSGNASVIINSLGEAVLLDCGVSWRRITTALAAIGITLSQIKGVVITHEHTDHIKGLATMLRHTSLAVYANPKTAAAISGKLFLPPETICTDDPEFCLGSFRIVRFASFHDAVAPAGYLFYTDGKKIAALTDCGHMDAPLLEHLSESDLVYLESNHDVTMLRCGSYPPPLKARILSPTGHLSNDECAMAVSALAMAGLPKLVLGHLSEHNNSPLLVRDKISKALSMYGKNTEYWLADASDTPLVVEV